MKIQIHVSYGRWLRRIGPVKSYLVGVFVGVWLGIAIERLLS